MIIYRKLAVAELRYMYVECGKCHTEVLLDLEGSQPSFGKNQTQTVRPECAGCGEKMEGAAEALRSYRNLYEVYKKSENPVAFRIQDERG